MERRVEELREISRREIEEKKQIAEEEKRVTEQKENERL
jgi:hypothetical protein